MEDPRIVSLQVGKPRTYGRRDAETPEEREWTSATVKDPVSGKVWLTRTGLEGDGQADIVAHGGPDKAVLVYSAESYPLWHRELGRNMFPYGGFGENWTVTGLTETDVCIGDVFAVADAIVQVSQPRIPCWKQARRWGIPDLVERIQESGRAGWYLRVLQEASVEQGDGLRQLERPHPEWSVRRAFRAIVERRQYPQQAKALAAVPALAHTLRPILDPSRKTTP